MGSLRIAGTIARQTDVPFSTIKTFTPSASFKNDVGLSLNYLFTMADEVF